MIQDPNALIDEQVSVVIQYIDTDQVTILNERRYTGVVASVDELEGITVRVEDNDSPFTMLPPSTEAWTRNDNKQYQAHWLVYRKQEKRTDGEHEWWDWQPKK